MGGVNKTINITQKASNLGSIEIAGGVYSNGTLVALGSFGMSTDIRVSMTGPQMGRFIFPTPIQEMGRFNGNHASFLRITVNEEYIIVLMVRTETINLVTNNIW